MKNSKAALFLGASLFAWLELTGCQKNEFWNDGKLVPEPPPGPTPPAAKPPEEPPVAKASVYFRYGGLERRYPIPDSRPVAVFIRPDEQDLSDRLEILADRAVDIGLGSGISENLEYWKKICPWPSPVWNRVGWIEAAGRALGVPTAPGARRRESTDLIESALRQDPFGLVSALEIYFQRIRRLWEAGFPDLARDREGAVTGVLVGSSGLLLGLPGMGEPAGLLLGWSARDFSPLRSAFNRLRVAKVVLDEEARLHGLTLPITERAPALDRIDRFGALYAELSRLFVAADRLSVRRPGLAGRLNSLTATAGYFFEIAAKRFGVGDKIWTAPEPFLDPSPPSLGALTRELGEALAEIPATRAVLVRALGGEAAALRAGDVATWEKAMKRATDAIERELWPGLLPDVASPRLPVGAIRIAIERIL